jgi:hypothetical protein
VRNDGHQQVGGIFAPRVFEEADQGTVKKANGGLQHPEEDDGPQGPAVLQEDIVLLLDADAGQPAKNVQLVGELLKLDQLDLPRSVLLGKHRLEGYGGIAVPPTRIMEENVYFFHYRIVTYALYSPGGANGMPC